MFHEATLTKRAYYDTLEEMPNTARVTFPYPNKETREMTAEEICALDNEGWYTIMHSCNYGCCDHWTSEKPSKWVHERFEKIYHYVDNQGRHVGYNRGGWCLTLTKDANYWKSEVWNS